MDVCTRKLCRERQNGERRPVLILVPGTHERLTSTKRVMCARNLGAHVRHRIRSAKGKNGMRNNWSPVQPRKVQKKLVSSNVPKILEKETCNKIRENSEKTMFTPLNLNKATAKSYCYCLAIRRLPNCKHEFSIKILPGCQQIFSNICLPVHKQQFSKKKDHQRVFSNICLPDHKQRFRNKMSKNASN